MSEEPKPVTFVWPSAGGNRTGICHMMWSPGYTLKNYFHQPPLKQHGLLGMWKRCKTYDQHHRKVKLIYIPQPGDTIVMSRARRYVV